MLAIKILRAEETGIENSSKAEDKQSLSLYERYEQLPPSIKDSGDMKLILDTLETVLAR